MKYSILALAFFLSGTAAYAQSIHVSGPATEISVDTAAGFGVAETSASTSVEATVSTETSPAPVFSHTQKNAAAMLDDSVSSVSDVSSNKTLESYVALAVNTNENLSSVGVDASGTLLVGYRQPARLFGFIPMQMTSRVRVTKDAEVTLSYPWYSFLVATDSKRKDLEERLQTDIKDALNSDDIYLVGVAGSAGVSTRMVENRSHALILQHVQATLAAEAAS